LYKAYEIHLEKQDRSFLQWFSIDLEKMENEAAA